jgi:hypothetical protein
MACLVKNNPLDKYCDDFKNILDNQDLIDDIELYDNYSTDNLYNDLSTIFKNDKYLNEKPLLKTVSLAEASFIILILILFSCRLLNYTKTLMRIVKESQMTQILRIS